MAKFLQQLLAAEEPLFSTHLQQLERASGQKGIDARLIADIANGAGRAMRHMGLDPQDTTGKEFYTSLLARFASDSRALAQAIGGTGTEIDASLIMTAAKKHIESTQCWALKPAKARELLRERPPQKLLDHFKVSSVEQLLDEKPLSQVYVALRFSEGDPWLRRFNEQLNDISANDFETRDIELLQLDETYASLCANFVTSRPHAVAHSKEFGVVALLPMEQMLTPATTFINLAFLLHYSNEIRIYGSYFQFKKTEQNFGALVAEALNNDVHEVGRVTQTPVHWRVVQRYFGAQHPEMLRPHIHPEDLYWQEVEAQLAQLAPNMQFWQGLEYVGKQFNDTIVSANLLDVAIAADKKLAYGHQPVNHMRESLWNEIVLRYIGEENLRQQLMVQLGAKELNLA